MISIYIIITLILDLIMASIISNSYMWASFILIPFTSLVFLLYISLKRDIYHVLFVAMLVGLGIDLFTHSALFLHAIIFVAALFIMRIYQRHMSDTMFEMVLMGLVIIFIVEVLLFLYYSLFTTVQIGFSLWYMRRLFVTMIGNLPLIIVAYYLARHYIKMVKAQETQKQRSETSLWRLKD
ncbi:MAG: hypothetical protein GX845_04040 [Erysipelothrix sp.]|nr:hypothetical protein [Erysipelothrix sp.]